MIHDITKELEEEKKNGEVGLRVILVCLAIIVRYLGYLVYGAVSNNY